MENQIFVSLTSKKFCVVQLPNWSTRQQILLFFPLKFHLDVNSIDFLFNDTILLEETTIMRKIIKRNKRYLGIILLLSSVAFFIFWEFVGRSELLYSEIVVLTEDVQRGSVITENMISYQKIDNSLLIENIVTNPTYILELEAKHFIPAGTQLSQKYFDVAALVLDSSEKIMKLPERWIHSFPETLRRKDEVYIFTVSPSITELSSAKNSVVAKETEDIFLLKTTVAFVKDSENKEVSSIDLDRLHGTSAINSIEIVITDVQFSILESYAEQGYTFALMYTN